MSETAAVETEVREEVAYTREEYVSKMKEESLPNLSEETVGKIYDAGALEEAQKPFCVIYEKVDSIEVVGYDTTADLVEAVQKKVHNLTDMPSNIQLIVSGQEEDVDITINAFVNLTIPDKLKKEVEEKNVEITPVTKVKVRDFKIVCEEQGKVTKGYDFVVLIENGVDEVKKFMKDAVGYFEQPFVRVEVGEIREEEHGKVHTPAVIKNLIGEGYEGMKKEVKKEELEVAPDDPNEEIQMYEIAVDAKTQSGSERNYKFFLNKDAPMDAVKSYIKEALQHYKQTETSYMTRELSGPKARITDKDEIARLISLK